MLGNVARSWSRASARQCASHRATSCHSHVRHMSNTGDGDKLKGPPLENPISRTVGIIKKDVEAMFSPSKGGVDRNMPSISTHCDVLVVGGGVIGSSIAYWLKQRTPKAINVVVVERDPTYTTCSTSLSVGGLRQQFSLEENIQMSMFGAEFIRKLPHYLGIEGAEVPDVNFHPHGYMFVASESGAQYLKENYMTQCKMGAKVELLSAKQLKDRFPWMNTEGIELACHGLENEGWFDPWSMLCAMKNKALHLGVEYVKGEAVGFEFRRMDDIIVEHVQPGQYEALDKLLVRTPEGEMRSIKFAIVVIAAGADSGKVGRMARIGTGPGMLSVPIPVERRKRYVYCFHAPDGPGLDCPFFIDHSGTYFRREGLAGNFLTGRSPTEEEEPDNGDLEVDYSYFDETIWPRLAHRVPTFENIKVKGAWAGYYDYNTFDQNAIIGPHPYYPNVLMATGFSGHGIQQAPAVGRSVMELILDGEFRTIDLSRFGFDRLIQNERVLESNIV